MSDLMLEGIDDTKITDISVGITAEYAYDLYKEKKRQIANLEFECNLLVDKYHSEMRHASIPMEMHENLIKEMFGKDKKKKEFARKFWLDKCFTVDFLQKHSIAFKELMWQGYGRNGAVITLDIDGCDYYYSVEIPFPDNIKVNETKKRLMGQVKFRADRILKSKWDDFVKEWEAVQMPTYDWKACFEAIEKDVAQ